MAIICSECGRDIDQIGQDNMSYTLDPLCEDCYRYKKKYEDYETQEDDWA